MLVSELNIIEFRGIRRCEKPLELSKFTVLIGRNNVGKSAILEALYLFPHPHKSDRIFSNGTKLSVVRITFHSGSHLAYGYSGTIKFEYTINHKHFCITIDDRSDAKLYVDNREITNISDKDLKNLLQVQVDSLADITVLIPNNTQLLKRFDSLIRKEWFKNKIMKLGLHVKVAKIIPSAHLIAS